MQVIQHPGKSVNPKLSPSERRTVHRTIRLAADLRAAGLRATALRIGHDVLRRRFRDDEDAHEAALGSFRMALGL